MPACLTSTAATIGQFVTVVLIFVFVLVLTAGVTRWIANYQRDKLPGGNITIIETKRIAQNKIVEILRIGDRYFAVALGKDEVTLISELSPDSIKFPETGEKSISFKEILGKMKDMG
ncbi:MAG: flagellar biosynthetic protein FliO [Lachnospiraceae bacterium]|nr:flagellar biosynthetic protein FliO [Lachnospiraceae bacterium]